MLDNGFTLHRIEMLNWGNFHGYQVLDLYQGSDDGPLYQPASHSAILGINGSGKSTIIDGLMMCLLPFERHLKLGVTNDVEYGGSGGRSVRDYILGKFASGDTTTGQSKSGSFGRQEGCSIFLLHFQHNRKVNKTLTLGRIWWYSNHVVQDTQYGFIAQRKISIQDLCVDQIAPKNAKEFRESIKRTKNDVQIFDSMGTYFQSLCSSLGNITKDDLKILNRAFYVKSIEQIDQFIRETMLVESENANLQSLLDHVRTGREIAHSIEECQKKIEVMGGLIKDFERLADADNKHQVLILQDKILDYYREWIEVKNIEKSILDLKNKIQNLNIEIPYWDQKVQSLQSEISKLQSLIAQQDIEVRLLQIETELKHAKEKQIWFERQNSEYISKCQIVILNPAQNKDGWNDFLQSCEKSFSLIRQSIQQNEVDQENLGLEKYTLDTQSESLRSEIEHVSKSGCLIPEDLYNIKLQACKELKIPQPNLRFVGELIQVNSKNQKYRRAIESVLFPISRNLLCAPENRDALTKWLDQQGLKSDITVKRISESELNLQMTHSQFDQDDILSYIEILSSDQHPFSHYLWNWLLSTFDYKLVEVGKFKNSSEKVVTIDGLVKTDSRTMRKLKKNFSYNLGWDNSDLLSDFASQLQMIHDKRQKTLAEIEQRKKTLQNLHQKSRILDELQKLNCDFLDITEIHKYIQKLTKEQKVLFSENPDFQKLKDQLQNLQKEISIAFEQLHGKKERNKDFLTDLERNEKILPLLQENLRQSLLFHSLIQKLESEELLEIHLKELHEQIADSSGLRQKKQDQLKSEIEQIYRSKNGLISRLSSLLTAYERDFHDPNLPYKAEMEYLPEIMKSWSNAFNRLQKTELPQAEEKWRQFFEETLIQSVRDTIDEIKRSLHEITQNLRSINDVLQLTNFEDLPTEKRYLKIDFQSSHDDRIRRFRLRMSEVEKILGVSLRMMKQDQSQQVMKVLADFVDTLQQDTNYRDYVMDVRNHFQFKIHSLRRIEAGPDELVEVFEGARKDAKSSAQTTHLAYTLLASCLAYRFHFNDPSKGEETPRLIILDEFGGKFDNEKPKDIVALLEKMGFQAILVSPMSKADLLADKMNQLALVYKNSASHSKVQSFQITSKEQYLKLVGKNLTNEIKNKDLN
jgi:uncharacterized protein YPO0396